MNFEQQQELIKSIVEPQVCENADRLFLKMFFENPKLNSVFRLIREQQKLREDVSNLSSMFGYGIGGGMGEALKDLYVHFAVHVLNHLEKVMESAAQEESKDDE